MRGENREGRGRKDFILLVLLLLLSAAAAADATTTRRRGRVTACDGGAEGVCVLACRTSRDMMTG